MATRVASSRSLTGGIHLVKPNDKPLKLLLTGGGSGGHITPLLAVADELKSLKPDSIIVSVGEHGSKFAHLTDAHKSIDATRSIFAGKFRRYHGEAWYKKLLDVRTILLNIRDVFFVVIGTIQAIILVKREKPDVVFLKGGFVGVPIGLAAALWRVPMVTHDSDALPGLANRLVSRWVAIHATGMPAEFYQYPVSKVRHVGVLVSRHYAAVDDNARVAFRKEIELPEQGRLLFITGGSLGSQRVNTAVVSFVQKLLQDFTDLHIVHQVGKGNLSVYNGQKHERLHVLEFLEGMHRYSGAADVIVTRAGANTIAEFGIQGKACVVIPSPFLAGGHQLKNGEYLQQMKAAEVVDEAAMIKDPNILLEAIKKLLHSAEERTVLGAQLQSLAVPNAAQRLAEVLLEVSDEE